MAANKGLYGLTFPPDPPHPGVYNAGLQTYVWPAGTPQSDWVNGQLFAGDVTNSSYRAVEAVFDLSRDCDWVEISGVGFSVTTLNAGAGASMGFAAYRMPSPNVRTLISVLGSGPITSTGAKNVTIDTIRLPAVFSVVCRLVSVDTGGANPAFAAVAQAPQTKYHTGNTPGWGNATPQAKYYVSYGVSITSLTFAQTIILTDQGAGFTPYLPLLVTNMGWSSRRTRT
jgi:hypothetical protein